MRRHNYIVFICRALLFLESLSPTGAYRIPRQRDSSRRHLEKRDGPPPPPTEVAPSPPAMISVYAQPIQTAYQQYVSYWDGPTLQEKQKLSEEIYKEKMENGNGTVKCHAPPFRDENYPSHENMREPEICLKGGYSIRIANAKDDEPTEVWRWQVLDVAYELANALESNQTRGSSSPLKYKIEDPQTVPDLEIDVFPGGYELLGASNWNMDMKWGICLGKEKCDVEKSRCPRRHPPPEEE